MSTSRRCCRSIRKRPGWSAHRDIWCWWVITPFSNSVACRRALSSVRANRSQSKGTCICSASMFRRPMRVAGYCANCTNVSLMRHGLPGVRAPRGVWAGRSASSCSGKSGTLLDPRADEAEWCSCFPKRYEKFIRNQLVGERDAHNFLFPSYDQRR